jgi:hypothetical protein
VKGRKGELEKGGYDWWESDKCGPNGYFMLAFPGVDTPSLPGNSINAREVREWAKRRGYHLSLKAIAGSGG